MMRIHSTRSRRSALLRVTVAAIVFIASFWLVSSPASAARGAAVIAGSAGSTQAVSDNEGPAPGEVSWGLAPGETEQPRTSFAFQAEPGQSLQDDMQIINYGVEPLELDIYSADALTTETGEFALGGRDETPVGVGSWVSAEQSSVSIPPGEARDIGFSLNVPRDASPGEHLGGLISSQSSDASGTLAVERRLAMQILVTVSGEIRPEARISDISVDSALAWIPFMPVTVEVTASVQNTGNSRARARVITSGSGLFGLMETSQAEEVEEIIPDGRIEHRSQLRLWPSVVNTVEVETIPQAITGEVGENVRQHHTVVLIPWGTLVVVLVILVGLSIWWVRRRRRAKTSGEVSG